MNNNLINRLKFENKILELQRKYESGKILEEELTEEEKEEMLALYNKQINGLEITVKQYEKELEYYKQEIIKKRKKLENK